MNQPLYVPNLDPDTDTLTAALVYAEAGFYVGPIRLGKHPGSVLGKHWPAKTSRDPQVLTSWFAGSDYGVFLHCGRSGVVVFDVDTTDALPAELLDVFTAHSAPFQSTRDDDPQRGHYLFAMPPDRDIGNSTGSLPKGWGEVRGRNGVIVLAPSPHPKAAEGGRYAWRQTGPVPVLPSELAEALPDASSGVGGAASDAAVERFLDTHTAENRPGLLAHITDRWTTDVEQHGRSRHETAVDLTCWAMKEAACGFYPAGKVAGALRERFAVAINGERNAEAEFDSVLAYAVAAAEADDTEQRRVHAEQRLDNDAPAANGTGEADDNATVEVPRAAPRAPVIEMGTVARRSWRGRPRLHITSAPIAAEWLRETIGTDHLAGVFLRGGQLVHTPREGAEGYVELRHSTDHDSDGPAQVHALVADQVTAMVQFGYQCYRGQERTHYDENTNEEIKRKVKVAAMFPRDATRSVFGASPATLPNVRRLRGVTHTPIPRADGSILDTPGYDDATGLLYLPEVGVDVGAIPTEPTDAQVLDAACLLGDMLAEFDFVSEHHQANYLGALLTPLLRELVGPPYKLVAINAHQRGSGKSLLAALLRIVHGGVFRGEMPRDAEEERKQISSILDTTTAPVVTFDNVAGNLTSPRLAALLTSAE